MNFVKKNKIIFFAFLFLFFIVNKEIYAKSYKINDMQIDAVVEENGDLQINQKIQYNFNGVYNGIYIDIPCYLDSTKYDKKRKQTSELKDSLYNGDDVLIKNVSVNNKQYVLKNNAKNGEVGVYTQENQKENLRVKVYSPSSYETKIFNVSYIIKNVAVSHTDVAEIYIIL